MNICAKTKVVYINGDQTDLDTWIVNLDVFRERINTTTIDLSNIDKDGFDPLTDITSKHINTKSYISLIDLLSGIEAAKN